LLFLKFALRLPYRQKEGVARETFRELGIKIPNFRTLGMPPKFGHPGEKKVVFVDRIIKKF